MVKNEFIMLSKALSKTTTKFMSFKRALLTVLLFSLALQVNSTAQIIHKNDLESAVGILKTSLPDRPRNLHRDSTYISNEPLELEFTDFFIKDPGNLDDLYPLYDEEGFHNSRLSLGHRYSHLRTLRFHNGRTMLVLLKNERHESGTYYLTSWKVVGDSLHFEKLYHKPLGVGIGSMRIDPNYKGDSKGNSLFVLQKLMPDIGYDFGSYHLFQFTRYGDFHELWAKTYYTNLQGKTGNEYIVMYKLLSGNDFLLQEYWYDLEQINDPATGNPRGLLERTLTDSKFELIDLRDLVVSEY